MAQTLRWISAAIKATDDMHLQVLGLPFGPDTQGQWFDENTNVDLEPGDVKPVYYYHGFGERTATKVRRLGKAVYRGIGELAGCKGHLFDVTLDRAHAMAKSVYDAAKAGLARCSSDSTVHLVRPSGIVGQPGVVTSWPIFGLSLMDADTARLAVNPQAVALAAAKAYADDPWARKILVRAIDKRIAAVKGGTWDESKHPRAPAGSPEGGQFTESGDEDLSTRPGEGEYKGFEVAALSPWEMRIVQSQSHVPMDVLDHEIVFDPHDRQEVTEVVKLARKWRRLALADIARSDRKPGPSEIYASFNRPLDFGIANISDGTVVDAQRGDRDAPHSYLLMPAPISDADRDALDLVWLGRWSDKRDAAKAGEWDESKHPREAAGSPEGGQFAPKEGPYVGEGRAVTSMGRIVQGRDFTQPARTTRERSLEFEDHMAKLSDDELAKELPDSKSPFVNPRQSAAQIERGLRDYAKQINSILPLDVIRAGAREKTPEATADYRAEEAATKRRYLTGETVKQYIDKYVRQGYDRMGINRRGAAKEALLYNAPDVIEFRRSDEIDYVALLAKYGYLSKTLEHAGKKLPTATKAEVVAAIDAAIRAAKGGTWDESKHPRVGAGSPEGGQFTAAGGATGSGNLTPKQVYLRNAAPAELRNAYADAQKRLDLAQKFADESAGKPHHARALAELAAFQNEVKFIEGIAQTRSLKLTRPALGESDYIDRSAGGDFTLAFRRDAPDDRLGNLPSEVRQDFRTMQNYMPRREFETVLASASRGEEREGFRAKMREMADRIRRMPVTYQQDGKGDKAQVYLHYFTRDYDAWITERDMSSPVDGPQHQAFGYARMGGQKPEAGYISVPELIKAGAELDLYFPVQTWADVRRTAAKAGEWDESKHPREAAGSPDGGQFAPKDGGATGESQGKSPFGSTGPGPRREDRVMSVKEALATSPKDMTDNELMSLMSRFDSGWSLGQAQAHEDELVNRVRRANDLVDPKKYERTKSFIASEAEAQKQTYSYDGEKTVQGVVDDYAIGNSNRLVRPTRYHGQTARELSNGIRDGMIFFDPREVAYIDALTKRGVLYTSKNSTPEQRDAVRLIARYRDLESARNVNAEIQRVQRQQAARPEMEPYLTAVVPEKRATKAAGSAEWDESKHPRVGAGSPEGGEFTEANGPKRALSQRVQTEKLGPGLPPQKMTDEQLMDLVEDRVTTLKLPKEMEPYTDELEKRVYLAARNIFPREPKAKTTLMSMPMKELTNAELDQLSGQYFDRSDTPPELLRYRDERRRRSVQYTRIFDNVMKLDHTTVPGSSLNPREYLNAYCINGSKRLVRSDTSDGKPIRVLSDGVHRGITFDHQAVVSYIDALVNQGKLIDEERATPEQKSGLRMMGRYDAWQDARNMNTPPRGTKRAAKAGEWDESKHPREAAGKEEGGQFTEGSGASPERMAELRKKARKPGEPEEPDAAGESPKSGSGKPDFEAMRKQWKDKVIGAKPAATEPKAESVPAVTKPDLDAMHKQWKDKVIGTEPAEASDWNVKHDAAQIRMMQDEHDADGGSDVPFDVWKKADTDPTARWAKNAELAARSKRYLDGDTAKHAIDKRFAEGYFATILTNMGGRPMVVLKHPGGGRVALADKAEMDYVRLKVKYGNADREAGWPDFNAPGEGVNGDWTNEPTSIFNPSEDWLKPSEKPSTAKPGQKAPPKAPPAAQRPGQKAPLAAAPVSEGEQKPSKPSAAAPTSGPWRPSPKEDERGTKPDPKQAPVLSRPAKKQSPPWAPAQGAAKADLVGAIDDALKAARDTAKARGEWREELHPRHPAGSPQGGEFAEAEGSMGELMPDELEAMSREPVRGPTLPAKPRQRQEVTVGFSPNTSQWKAVADVEKRALDPSKGWDAYKNDVATMLAKHGLRDKLERTFGLWGSPEWSYNLKITNPNSPDFDKRLKGFMDDWGATYKQEGVVAIVPKAGAPGRRVQWTLDKPLSNSELDSVLGNLNKLQGATSTYLGATVSADKQTVSYWASSSTDATAVIHAMHKALAGARSDPRYKLAAGKDWDWRMESAGSDYQTDTTPGRTETAPVNPPKANPTKPLMRNAKRQMKPETIARRAAEREVERRETAKRSIASLTRELNEATADGEPKWYLDGLREKIKGYQAALKARRLTPTQIADMAMDIAAKAESASPYQAISSGESQAETAMAIDDVSTSVFTLTAAQAANSTFTLNVGRSK